eukprot:COSAG05_NODE_704_length_7857_cov_2.807038_4_plen_227_part_00
MRAFNYKVNISHAWIPNYGFLGARGHSKHPARPTGMYLLWFSVLREALALPPAASASAPPELPLAPPPASRMLARRVFIHFAFAVGVSTARTYLLSATSQGTDACPYNRPCAQQYVGKSQPCMVVSGRLIVHAPGRHRKRRQISVIDDGCLNQFVGVDGTAESYGQRQSRPISQYTGSSACEWKTGVLVAASAAVAAATGRKPPAMRPVANLRVRADIIGHARINM